MDNTPDYTQKRRTTPKQNMHLLFARVMWHAVMDAHVADDLRSRREIKRQLKLAKATVDDL